jgi:hypothetical protein
MKDEIPEGKNLLLENLIVALSRIGLLKKLMRAINERANRIINRRGFETLPETTKDDIKDIRDISKTSSKD